MSSTLTVRRIAADQGDVYRELRAASLREPYAPGEAPEAELLNVDSDAAAAIAAQRAASDTSTTFVLYTEGHPAGMIGAYFDNSPERRAFVSELWVAHAVRHLRGGVLLVETATGWLAERGAQDVYAWIADANRNAIRFLRTRRFQQHRRTRADRAHAGRAEVAVRVPRQAVNRHPSRGRCAQ